ncbi:Tad domain-containing protein [Poriferisphaera corsica]|nr:Tad domain-containing protein [Poriferisphaera corsica]
MCNEHRSCGAVFILVMLAILLIAAITFYVFNAGRHIQGRVETQNAADASAMAGGTEIARTFNTIAMNQVQTARVISAINVIDSLPQAIDYIITSPGEMKDGELTALDHVLKHEYGKRPLDPWYQNLLKRAHIGHGGSTQTVIPMLLEMDALYNGNSSYIPTLTFYNHPTRQGRGKLWESIYSMYQQNKAMVETIDDRVESAVDETTRQNIRSNRDAGAIMLPLINRVPIVKGNFNDYERPIKRGMLPGPDDPRLIKNDSLFEGLGVIDHRVDNRGPWDTLMGWRRTDLRTGEGDVRTLVRYRPPHRIMTNQEQEAAEKYWVYGPQEWLLDKLTHDDVTIEDRGALHRLDEKVLNFSSYKLDYLFPGANASPRIRSMYKPNWEVDLSIDNQRSNDNNGYSIRRYILEAQTHPWEFGESMYLVCEMKSRFANNKGNPNTQGITWNYIKRNNRPMPFLDYSDSFTRLPYSIPAEYIIEKDEWIDPITKVLKKAIIKAKYKTEANNFELGGDSEIGLEPKIIGRNPDGTYIYASQTVYWTTIFVYVGTDVHDIPEGKQPIRNPHAGFNRHDAGSPVPFDLNHELMRPRRESTDARLQFLNISYVDDQAEIWSEKFDRNRPYRKMVGLSQVRLFNNHSWDLWTQMWHAQLEPVQDYDQWVDLFNQGDVMDLSGKDSGEMYELGRYLESLKTMSDFGRH